MKNLIYISHSTDETLSISTKIAKFIAPGDCIVLTGELGAGKTKFTEGFLSYYNLEDEISSPTFNIVNEYTTNNINIYHFDVYRLADIDEFYAIGGEEYFDKGICLIEWGEQIEEALLEDYIKINFEKDIKNENLRILKFEAIGTKYEKILEALPNSNFIENNTISAKNVGLYAYAYTTTNTYPCIEPLYLRKSEAERKLEN